MRDRNNPLKNIPPGAFTIIQASHAEFHKELSDIPARYPSGRISYINNHQFVPLIMFKEEEQDRLDHLMITEPDKLLSTIESDTSAILFIEYHLSWFKPDSPEELNQFCEICRSRAKRGGPVVLITAILDRGLLALEGKADFFFQMGKIKLAGIRLKMKEQRSLDETSCSESCCMERVRMYGQMKLEI
jgi:hypothetical protein